MSQVRVVLYEYLGTRLLPDLLDANAPTANDLARHPFRDAEAEDVLARLLAQELRALFRRVLALLLTHLYDLRQNPFERALDAGRIFGVDAKDAVVRVGEVVLPVAEDKLRSCLLLDLVLHGPLRAQEAGSKAVRDQNLERVPCPRAALVKAAVVAAFALLRVRPALPTVVAALHGRALAAVAEPLGIGTRPARPCGPEGAAARARP
mmetsp:Transcript_73716/g.238272  ORF Transcript_73716/g.238272 Transcript_73716/m.238272 type:complete len:207 (-) Transcript_73716:7-627(-)